MRQDGGFHGRPGKPSDTCYSFWIGATLEMLGVSSLSNSEENRAFVLTTQDTVAGGFAKFNHVRADPLHTYLGKFICFCFIIYYFFVLTRGSNEFLADQNIGVAS